MAYDKAVDSEALDTALTYTADRIRNKSGGTAQIPWDSAKGFGDAVDGIETGILPTGTIDITANGTYDVADKATANVSVEAGVDYLELRISDKLTSYSNENVTALASYAFANCINLTELHTPNVSTFGMMAVTETKITEFIITTTSNTRIVGSQAFKNNTLMSKFDVNNLYILSGASAFNGCKVLDTLIIRNTDTAAKLSTTSAFTGTPIKTGTGYIYVPAAMVETYKAATNWSAYADQIRAIEDYPKITGGASA